MVPQEQGRGRSVNDMIRDILAQHPIHSRFPHNRLNLPLGQADFGADLRIRGSALEGDRGEDVEVVDGLLGGIIEGL